MNEFELIKKYFTKHANDRSDVILGVGDDCAILQPPVDQQLVMTMDTLVENVHFTKKTPIHDIGYKSLAVSLSDIAAMGAEPAWVMLSLILPEADENWLKEFCLGFYALLNKFSLALIGGNISRGSELSVTTQVTGFLPAGEELRRSGANPDDLIYVSGTVGDAAVALQMINKKIKIPDEFQEQLLQRLHRPEPRVREGITLRKLATSCIDVSDGLLADLNHLLGSSNVGATIKTHRLPLSKLLRTHIKPEIAWRFALGASDDYELCFTIPPALQSTFELMFGSYDCGYICIGHIEKETGLRILAPTGKEFKIDHKGYEHFS
jgi:thiamine-monophosphate kinase